ncbi:MAG: hypothetical protein Q4C13_07665, partial [Clostridia bacterium]|nr:hypothetical protein [Clostridia bacterium]
MDLTGILDGLGQEAPAGGRVNTEELMELINKTFLSGTLFALDKLLNLLASVSPAFKAELKKHNVKVQLKLRDDSYGRLLCFEDGLATSASGVFRDADVEMIFQDEDTARRVMLGQMLGKTMDFVNAAKQNELILNGPDEQAMWFSSLLLKVFAFDVLYLRNYGTRMKNGEMRYVTGTNGGPLFVYVKDGKIVRVTPIDFDDEDPEAWTIHARGKAFTPPR